MSFHTCDKCGGDTSYNGETQHYYCTNRKCMLEDYSQNTGSGNDGGKDGSM